MWLYTEYDMKLLKNITSVPQIMLLSLLTLTGLVTILFLQTPKALAKSFSFGVNTAHADTPHACYTGPECGGCGCGCSGNCSSGGGAGGSGCACDCGCNGGGSACQSCAE